MRALVADYSMSKLVLTTLLGRLDKRLYFGPHSTLALKELPDPALPAPDWVTIRTHLCGICGSDYKQVFLNGSVDNPMTALISFPQVLGHEVVGTIDRVGPAVRSRRLGERVVLNPWLSCAPRGIEPPCPACRNGQYSICRNFARGLLPPGIHTGNSSKGTTALVYGCGTLGLMAIAILRALAPTVRVIAVARFPHQKALAERFGAALVLAHEPLVPLIERIAAETGAELMRPWHGAPWLHGGGIGVVYDTVGSPETVEVALRVAAPRGAVVVTGVEMPRRFEWTPLYFKEIEVVGSNAFGVEDFEGRRRHAMEIYFELVASGRIDVTPVVTHRFGLDNYRRAFLACAKQDHSGAVKVLFTYDDGGAGGGRH